MTLSFNAFSESRTLQGIPVSGVITDAAGDVLPGVNILIKGTSTGVVSDANGKYAITVPDANAVLVFSSVGYASQEINVEARRVIDVFLSEEATALDEVVVVAYGTARKKDLTGSVSTVDTKLLTAQSHSTVTRALEGAVAGLQVSAVDGQPGLDMGIRVRGQGTADQSNSGALVVIDGVPMESGTAVANPLSIINSKDIASITVLKDAASTALYGSRGANGVILITTKKGATGKPRVSVEARWGINQHGPNIFKDMTPAEVYEYTWQMNYNSYRFGMPGANGGSKDYMTNVQNPNATHEQAAEFASQHLFDYNGSSSFQRNVLGNWMLYHVPGAIYTNSFVDPNTGLPDNTNSNRSSTMTGAYLVNTDGKLNPNAVFLGSTTYDDELLVNRFRQEYNIAASGGSEKVDYHVSLGYLEDPSFITTSKFQRYNGRAVVNAQIYDWLKAGANVAYSDRVTQSPPNRSGEGRNMGDNRENLFALTTNYTPLAQLYQRDENWNIKTDPVTGKKLVHQRAGDSWSPLGLTGNPYAQFDVLRVNELDKDVQYSKDVNTRTYAEIKFLKDFTFTTNFALDNTFIERTRYRNGENGRAAGTAWFGKESWTISNLNTQQLLNYSHDFNKHHVDALLGHEFNQYGRKWQYFRSTHELIPGFATYVNFVGKDTGDRMNSNGGGEDKYALESYLGRANYVYDNKYYASASLRRDGSSKFKYAENRWGTFWSIGGGWRISAEEFMQSTQDWLNNLKVRVSYGVIGNQNGISTYSGYQTWGYSANYTSATNGQGTPASYNLSQSAYVNDLLTWENNRTLDIGLEVSLLDRVHATFDWYNRDNVNAFYNTRMPYSMGQTAITNNAAQIRNNGFEAELTVDIIKRKDMSWTVSLNATHYNTIMKKLPDGEGQAALDGNVLASGSGWAASGSGGTNDVFLRGTGLPYYNVYLFHYEGVDQTTGLPLYYHKVTQEDLDKGLFQGKKVGDGASVTNLAETPATRKELGDALPEVTGGFSTTFAYKGFDATVALAYQIGGKYFSREYIGYHYATEMQRDGGLTALSPELVNNTWTPTNTNAKFPMAMYNNGNGLGSGTVLGSWGQFTDLALFDASYLSVKNITIGYTLPAGMLSKLGISSLRIYVEGDNLLLFSSHAGVDPRMSLVGGFDVDNFVYPFVRTYNVGINLDF
jgi:TonB-linked SusC/RagA family outer membrane protein